ncbi:MAG: hypothetical protein ABFR63_07160 [Thermodesulfobacteriota bacterium]
MTEKMQGKEHNTDKGSQGNRLVFIIIACWLLFSLYVGYQGGG